MHTISMAEHKETNIRVLQAIALVAPSLYTGNHLIYGSGIVLTPLKVLHSLTAMS